MLLLRIHAQVLGVEGVVTSTILHLKKALVKLTGKDPCNKAIKGDGRLAIGQPINIK
jgi:hypothetical protein